MVSFNPSDLQEDCDPQLDDTQVREIARENLLKSTMGTIGNELIDHFKYVRWRPGSFKAVLECYKEFRDQAKKLMNGNSSQRDFSRIDRHKMGAAFMLAILAIKPLHWIGKDVPGNAGEKYLNQMLAFRTAVSILGIFLRYEFRHGVANAISISCAVFPLSKGSPYREHAYRALAHASGGDHPQITLPVLAHWMFYIERYWLFHYLANQLENAPDKSDETDKIIKNLMSTVEIAGKDFSVG